MKEKYFVDINSCNISNQSKNLINPFVVMLSDTEKNTLYEQLKTKIVLDHNYQENDRRTQKSILNNLISIANFLKDKLV